MRRPARVSWTLGVCALVGGCALAIDDPIDIAHSGEAPSWEEFRAAAYLEPWPGGVFVIDGDFAIEDEKKLHELWKSFRRGGLVVHRAGGADARWPDSIKRNLTYCISDSFGHRKPAVVEAMRRATEEGWELFADLRFLYLPAHDADCTAANDAVLFDVRPVHNQPYLARAFLPGQPRWSRNLLIDSSSFAGWWPLEGIVAHEVGHALGFRHEHTRPEAAGHCHENSSWRPLTPYDSASIMHYPQCGGTGPALTFSTRDAEGAAALYGPALGQSTSPGGEEPLAGVPREASHSRSLAEGESVTYQPLAVVPGSVFRATLTGTGDADLYVRFGAAPTLQSFDCRPFLSGSNESCALDVPAGAGSAFVMVHGHLAADYTIEVAWLEPLK